jgi:hypothetical protein
MARISRWRTLRGARRAWCVASFVVLFCASCATAPSPTAPEPAPSTGFSSSAAAEHLGIKDHTVCSNFDQRPPLVTEEWRHDRSDFIADLGSPRHFPRDAVTTPAADEVVLEAKFTYGPTSKDIEDEKVRVLLQTCDEWRVLGEELTDDDGWVHLRLEDVLEPGIYRIRFEQVANRSFTTSKLWVLPEGTKVAVFDIDATLTTSNTEAAREVADDVLAGGDYDPEAYPDGAELTHFYLRRGYLPLYLTGRPYWFDRLSRAWLGNYAMAPGVVRLTTGHSESWPSDSAVGAFKEAELLALEAAGLDIEVAHGNATTDISAYLGAGLDPDNVWIIGDHAGARGTQPVEGGWEELVRELREAHQDGAAD